MGKKKRGGGGEAAVMRKKKRKRGGRKSLQLSEDLITDIISRVPNKDLMRFTCLSKSWCSLIISTDSYLSQLRSHRAALPDRPFLIMEKRESLSRASVVNYNYWLELDSIEDGNPNPRQLHNPFDDDDCPCVKASCEGLVVLQQRSSHKMVVLNPNTKKHHVVPPNPAGDDHVELRGFGYDHVHGCCKLVTKTKLRYDRTIELMIYNVNNGTWKKSRFEGLDNRFDDEDYCSVLGKCADGALYWGVYFEMEMTHILCFILAEEEFHKLDLPDFDPVMLYGHGYVYHPFWNVFDDRLCLVCQDPHGNERVEIWVMECDHKRQIGSSYSWPWVNLLSVSDPKTVLPPHSHPAALVPICFSACRNEILFNVEYGQLFWFDLRNNKYRKLKTRVGECINVRGRTNVTICVSSLVEIGIPEL